MPSNLTASGRLPRYTHPMTADELLASIRRLPLPERLRVIQQAAKEAEADTRRPGNVTEAEPGRRALTVDELLAARITPPPGVEPVRLDDIKRAIELGATDRAHFGLDAKQWEAFQAALDAPTRPMPHMRQLLSTPSVFEKK